MKNGMIIVAAPSGAGKSSFVNRIIVEEPSLVDVVTYTTRSKRAGEIDGVSYHFVAEKTFEELLAKNFFVESARVHNNYYGTPLNQIDEAWAENRCVIMDIDVQGSATLRKRFPESKHIFILPPSIEELRRRVIKRAGGTMPNDLELRMQNAKIEMAQAHLFDFQVINDRFDESYAVFKEIVIKIIQR